jgi:rare lipoprotein A
MRGASAPLATGWIVQTTIGRMDRPPSTRSPASRAGAGGLLIVACLATACAGHRDAVTVPGGTPGAVAFERGTASWYGRKFHGRKTASGERYDMNELTAAHRSLPFGTIVRVVRLDTGDSVVVRINDRGPFVDGRIIDLSRAAAIEIGMVRDGLVRVELYLLE